jgi:hypothetical protein
MNHSIQNHSGEFDCRVEFQFTDQNGICLKSKSWEVIRRWPDAPRIHLVQFRAELAAMPDFTEVSPNYYLVKVATHNLKGDLLTTTFRDGQQEQLQQQIAEFPLSFVITISANGLNFKLFTATPRKYE